MAYSESTNDARDLQPFAPGASAGLFVGVSDFEDERLAPVPFAVDDAVDLGHLFALELKLILPERTVLLLAGEPRKQESVERLAQLNQYGARRLLARAVDVYRFVGMLARGTEKNGIFVFTMATHGVSDQGGDFLVATDSLRERTLRTGVAVSEVFDEIARSGAERRLVLLDACRERLSAGTRGEGDSAMKLSFAEAIAQAKGSVTLSAATVGGFAYDDPLRRNGVFTAAVLDGLHGGASAELNGWITVRTLAEFVQQKVTTWILRNRPGDTLKSLGIARHIEATAESVPLALHPNFKADLLEKPVLMVERADDTPIGNWRDVAMGIIDRSQKLLSVSDRAKADLASLRQRIPDVSLSPGDVDRELEVIFSRDIYAINQKVAIDRIEYRLGVQILTFCARECVPVNLAIIDFYANAAVRSERWADEFFDRHVSSFSALQWGTRKTAPGRVIRKLADFLSSKMVILIGDWKVETLRPLLKNVAEKLAPYVASVITSFYNAFSEEEEADLPAPGPRASRTFLSSEVADWMERRVTIPWLNLFNASDLKFAQLTLVHAARTPQDRLRAILVKEILSNGERQDSSWHRDLARYLRTSFIASTKNSYLGLTEQRDKLAIEESFLRELERAKTEAADLLYRS